MRTFARPVARLWLVPALAALGGGALLGPSSLKAYNDAIVATNSQQVLAMIAHMDYGEPAGLLAVSSVTTVSADAHQ
jgi:hypothetical protein